MNLGLEGKFVFVAASSKGLGKATALEYAREGARLTIASRNLEQLEQARDEIHAATGQLPAMVQMDVLNPADIRHAIQTAAAGGSLDVLITNAGGPPSGSFADLSEEAWQGGFELSLMSVIRMIREALPGLRAAGGGRIVNLASSSIKQPIEGLMLSNVFRAGVQALTKTLASELAPAGILINTIAPGRIATDRVNDLDRQRAEARQLSMAEIQAQAAALIPLGRIGDPVELARYALFHGSFANTYVTGQTLIVDGGMLKGI